MFSFRVLRVECCGVCLCVCVYVCVCVQCVRCAGCSADALWIIHDDQSRIILRSSVCFCVYVLREGEETHGAGEGFGHGKKWETGERMGDEERRVENTTK